MMLSRRSLLRGFGAAIVAFHAAPVLELIAKIEALPPTVPLTSIASFQALLEAYLPVELLREELMRKDYFLAKLPADNNWQGGTFTVPFFTEVV